MTVSGKVLKNGKAKKIVVMTYRPKKDSKRKMGHRQPYTKVEITAVGTAAEEKPAKKAAAPKAEGEKKPAAKKAAAPKAEGEKKPAAKKAPAKKEEAPAEKAVKKAPEKDTAKLFIEFGGNKFAADEIVEKCKAAYKADNSRKQVRSIEVYVKPEDNKAYYVVNGKADGLYIDL